MPLHNPKGTLNRVLKVVPDETASNWVARKAEFLALAHAHSGAVFMVTKDHVWWGRAGQVLEWLTRGKMTRERFLHDFATTLGPLHAYPREWASLEPGLIAHESRHTKQCEYLGWLVPIIGWFFGARVRAWAGLPLMGFLYLFFPLPAGLCWGRMWLELDANRANWRDGLKNGWRSPAQVLTEASWHADLVAGPEYLWSWPRKWTRRIYRRAAEKVIEQMQEA